MRISGYAARYNSLSGDLGGFVEKIAPGAFDKILKSKPDVLATMNHSPDKVLGRTSAGTLALRSDDKGLFFDVDLPNTSYAKDLHASVTRGDIQGASFAFTLSPDGSDDSWEYDEDDTRSRKGTRQVTRTIRGFSKLLDVAVVTSPAYTDTSVSARNMVAAECRSIAQDFQRGIRTRSGLVCPPLTKRDIENINYLSVRALAEMRGETYVDKAERRRRLLDFLL
jgi:HK97 family phage prohead protease